MKYLVRAAGNLLTKASSYYVPLFLKSSYTQARLMSTAPKKPSQKSLKGENLKMSAQKVPQYELDANSYRKRISIDCNDTDAIYGLAMCINLGASISPIDILDTHRAAIWLSKKITAADVQAALYRRILKFNSKHAPAIWGLAQCLRKGASPQLEDLDNTWLEGGNFMVEDGPGLTKPVILLLAKALEERSKSIEASLIENSKSPKKLQPK